MKFYEIESWYVNIKKWLKIFPIIFKNDLLSREKSWTNVDEEKIRDEVGERVIQSPLD